jgi:hypothetical protein
MRGRRSSRPTFDPAGEFVVTARAGGKPLPLGGVKMLSGEQVDKSKVDARRLRLMYEQRLIQYAPGCGPGAPAPRPLAVGPTDLENPGVASPPARSKKRAVPRRRLLRAA